MEILKENEEEQIHVLMVAFPSQGHLNPMLRLGKRLVNKGLHVTLATTEFTRHRMLKSSTINPTSPQSQSLDSRFASSLMVKA
jgi:UDP-glucose:(indol-3-yl)acetate beta-D-glucosyltransferase